MSMYKFRGYDIVGDKGWVYGDLTHNQKVTRTGLEPRTMVHGYEVAPESVGLFADKTDKKGKEIYVGDKVMVEDGKSTFTSEVIWRDGACIVENILPYPLSSFWSCELEVIGNVYEEKRQHDEGGDKGCHSA